MTKRVTIKDIADELGVSHSTVSRALANHPRTSESTKARVRTAAAQFGYVADSAARVMRSGRSRLVGLIVPDIRNDFYAALAKELAQSCNEAGYQMVLAITEDDADSELRHVRELCEVRAAGVALVPSRAPRPQTLKLLRRIVTVQLIRHNAAIRGDWLGINDRDAIRKATAHLLDMGHTEIAYLGGDTQLSTGRARLEGYCEALEQAGVPMRPELVHTGRPRAAFGHDAVKGLLARDAPPTALVATGARITQGAVEAAEDMGIPVPGRLAIAGFGDPPWFGWWRGGVTTLRLPVNDLARGAGSLLSRRIEDAAAQDAAECSEASRITYAADLIVRASSGPSDRSRARQDADTVTR